MLPHKFQQLLLLIRAAEMGFQPKPLGRALPATSPPEARWTTFPRGPRVSAQAHLENYGVCLLPRNWQVTRTRLLFAGLLPVPQSELRRFCLCPCVSCRLDSWPRRWDSTGGWFWSPAQGEVSTRRLEGTHSLGSRRGSSCRPGSVWGCGRRGGVGKKRPGERGAGRGGMGGEDVQLLLSGHRVCCGGRGGAGGRAWGATDSYPRGQLQPLPRPALCSRPWAPELTRGGRRGWAAGCRTRWKS